MRSETPHTETCSNRNRSGIANSLRSIFVHRKIETSDLLSASHSKSYIRCFVRDKMADKHFYSLGECTSPLESFLCRVSAALLGYGDTSVDGKL